MANKELDYLSMSDEDIQNMTGPVPVDTQENDDDEEKIAETAEEVSGEQESPESAEATDGDSQSEAEADEGESDEDDDAPEPGEKTASEEDEDSDAVDAQKTETSDSVDYKAEYERLLAPFRANGRDIKINSVDDAIALMQMGANYNKKMAALKPNLKLMKLLENNGLLSEEKISFLIDLEKKNPEAINKLVKDSGLDPMDLDAEKASAYRQTTYTVDDREIELDTVLGEIQGTTGYNQTLDIVGNRWDSASKQVIANNPQLLKVINDHVQSGIYELISKEIESERMFGRLGGLSDIEAYRRIGDTLHAKGGFNHLVQGSSPNQRQSATQKVLVTPKPKQADDDKRRDKKRAASPTKPAVSNSLPEDFNPLSLSDEEFGKLLNKQYL
jgi:hypothetical protein